MKSCKHYFLFPSSKSIFRVGMILLCWLSLSVVTPLIGQDTLEVLATEEVEETKSYKSRASFTANQYSDGFIEMICLLRVKVEETYQVIPDAKVSFFQVSSEGEEALIGEASTGLHGKAIFKTKPEGWKTDAEGNYHLISRFDGKNEINGSESELQIHPARLVIETIEEDSTYRIKALATADSPEGPQPIAEATVVLYIKRMFSSLKVGEETTDEEGFAEIELPGDLPGDENGNLVITAMIEESEIYGNLASTVTMPWGNIVTLEMKELPRALWSPHPPSWMVFAFFVLMGTVWIHYAIIVFKLFKIKTGKDVSGRSA